MEGVLSRRRDKTIAVVDVESGSAGVAILSLGQTGARVISNARISSGNSSEAGMQTVALSTALRSAAKQALEFAALAESRQPIKEVYAVLHAPLVHSGMARASRLFDNETRINDSFIGQVAKEAFASQSTIEPKHLLEAYAYQIELNGYETNRPDGKYAHQIDVTAFFSYCDPELKNALRTEILTAFPASSIVWRSGMRAGLTVLQATSQERRCVTVFVGSNDTYVTVNYGDHIVQCSVPEGSKTILTKIASANTAEETRAFLRMIANDACEGEKCTAVQKNLAVIEPELARAFGESFGPLSLERRFPDKLVLVADADVSTFLSQLFSRIDFTQFTATTVPFSVHVISAVELSPWLSMPEPMDTSLSIASALVNIERSTEA